ncbi:hypothetical protein WMY93_010697 [Mugilogobius chulae]|uniref:Uncharacterized protein n=1 Tax=Mugilogobius chulae TaxID=88201 RepID=A0AAW0PKI3_9GOBI
MHRRRSLSTAESCQRRARERNIGPAAAAAASVAAAERSGDGDPGLGDENVDRCGGLTFYPINEICGAALPRGEKHKMKKQFNRMRQLANQTVGR